MQDYLVSRLLPWVALFVLIAVGVISIWSEPGVAQAQTINNKFSDGHSCIHRHAPGG